MSESKAIQQAVIPSSRLCIYCESTRCARCMTLAELIAVGVPVKQVVQIQGEKR